MSVKKVGNINRSTKSFCNEDKRAPEHQAWDQAVEQVEHYLRAPAKLGDQWELADGGTAPRHQRWLVWGVFRHWLRFNDLLDRRLRKAPRPRILAMLLVALAELELADPEREAQAIHFAVEKAKRLSKGEARLVNAVLRGILRDAAPRADLAWRTSHPDWLVARWQQAYGEAAVARLLEWNQRPADHFLHWLDPVEPDLQEGLEATEWNGFWRITESGWDSALKAVQSGRACIQDPATRHPVGLAGIQPGESVIDLCAAPGGKTLCQVWALRGEGELLAVDLPGKRLERLRTNLRAVRAHFSKLALVVCGLDILDPEDAESLSRSHFDAKPGADARCFDVVVLDAPCSNTGVIRRKPDVRVRLEPADFERLPKLQLALLLRAADCLRAGGRLVYSTCSIDTDENRGVVDAFLRERVDFGLKAERLSFPWQDGHDGGAAFLLTHKDLTS